MLFRSLALWCWRAERQQPVQQQESESSRLNSSCGFLRRSARLRRNIDPEDNSITNAPSTTSDYHGPAPTSQLLKTGATDICFKGLTTQMELLRRDLLRTKAVLRLAPETAARGLSCSLILTETKPRLMMAVMLLEAATVLRQTDITKEKRLFRGLRPAVGGVSSAARTPHLNTR